MTETKDFRNYAFSSHRIEKCGKFLGNFYYWKLFIIENTLRIFIHSVLTVQYTEKGENWWDDLAGEAKNSYERNKKNYLKPEARFFSLPGKHPIYFIDIKDLNEILRANFTLFVPVIGESILNKLILDIETLRIPRNIIAHVNFPKKKDLDRINTFFEDVSVYIDFIKEKNIKVIIP